MKKLCLLMTVLLLFGSMPITATAAGNVFIIDNGNVYAGMDKAYKDGYTPSVGNGTATIVLPLITAGAVTGSSVTVTPDLGDVSSSPFVYRNYQRNVTLAENPVNGTKTTVSSYLVRFDLPLKSGRINGVYPVVITVRGKTGDNDTVTETFTTYVTITDGIKPNGAPETAPRPIHLSIDNQNIYEGMDKPYSEGYSPTIKNGVATIILPVLADGYLSGNTVTAVANLGEPSNSPFVFRTYQKDARLSIHSVNNNAKTVSSFYIRFDLTLTTERYNGVYPVAVTVQGKTVEGSIVSETFTVHVTITDGTDPNAAPGQQVVRLSIDNGHIYEGMDKSYSQGYSPAVKNGVATVILPVLCDGALKGNTITATPDLGDTSTSPFLYRNYQKDITLSNNSVNNGSDRTASYYIRFDLMLASERYNGVYPVAVTVQGKTEEGETVTEIFTAYVTITDGTDPNGAPGQQSVRLSIDNGHVYEGMDKSYSQGYSPIVKNGAATVILPVLCDEALQGNTITATPDLGDTSTSPFLYKNYQKDITLSNNTVNNSSDRIPSYYIRFDFTLAGERYNGVYPIVITLQGKTKEGEAVTETFTAYVTITDGKDPKEASETEAPTSQPIILVAKHHISPLPVQAGQEFTATITLKNTSETKPIQNMTVTAGNDSTNWTLLNESNVFYIKQLGSSETLDIEVKYRTDLETPAGNYNINLAIVYDNSDAQTLTASGIVPVEIHQQLQVELETPAIPKEVNAGDTIPLSFHALNLSRGKVFNVHCVLEAPGFIPSGTAFIGNMEAGTSASGDIDVFIGSKDMTEGYEGTDTYGITSGKVTLYYEDENGQQYFQEFDFVSDINAPVISTSANITEDRPDRASQWWISLAIGGIAIAGIAACLIMYNKHRGQSYADA